MNLQSFPSDEGRTPIHEQYLESGEIDLDDIESVIPINNNILGNGFNHQSDDFKNKSGKFHPMLSEPQRTLEPSHL